MKKLIYLIMAIAILGLIIPGCIPMVPPAEQDNLNTFTKSNGSEVWVDDDYCDGCFNDGHTWGTDAFATIQDGVDTVAAGGTVYVANGNYNATSSPFVRIIKSLSLIGESRDGVILDGTGTSTIAWAKGIHVTANNVTIENLTVQNFGAPGYWGYGVLFRDYAHDEPGEEYIYYTGCIAENIKSQFNCYPMYALVNQDLTINNCLIQDNLGDGMFIARGCDNVTITGNTVLNSGDHGIWVGNCWSSLGPSDNATITDNYVDGAREGGISFVGSDVATISGNTITNAAGEGWSKGALSFKDGPSNVEAYNNNIYNNDGAWSGYSGTGHGIGIDGTPSDIYLHHNSIYGNAGYGIYNYSTVTINATCNWWGDVSGPLHPTSWYLGLLEITNPSGLGDEVSDYVLYIPWQGIGGFVTGGGTIWSDAGNYKWDIDAEGQANFGFVSKYKKGKNVPDGSTNFAFQAGDLHFHSSSYDLLVVTGSDYAKFKGTGTINGSGEYKFMIWAGDGGKGGDDTFRISIWEEDEDGPEDVVYDNGMDQVIDSGSIVIHTKQICEFLAECL